MASRGRPRAPRPHPRCSIRAVTGPDLPVPARPRPASPCKAFSCADRGTDGSMAIFSFCGNRPIAPAVEQWEQVATAALLLASVRFRCEAQPRRADAIPGQARLENASGRGL